MSQGFTDIRLKELDDQASGPSGRGDALMRLVLRLSDYAPPQWSEYFNHAWQQNFYMMKRNARASGDKIEITCMPDELQSDHIPELKKVIAETNEAYRAFFEEQQERTNQYKASLQKQKDDLAKLKGSLKFD